MMHAPRDVIAYLSLRRVLREGPDAGAIATWDGWLTQASMLAARITSPHFSVSSAMKLPNSAGETMNGAASASASRALILG
jgi:hypothetical protein